MELRDKRQKATLDAADLTVGLTKTLTMSGSMTPLGQSSSGSSLPCYEACTLPYSRRTNLARWTAHGAAHGISAVFWRCSGAEARAGASFLQPRGQAMEGDEHGNS